MVTGLAARARSADQLLAVHPLRPAGHRHDAGPGLGLRVAALLPARLIRCPCPSCSSRCWPAGWSCWPASRPRAPRPASGCRPAAVPGPRRGHRRGRAGAAVQRRPAGAEPRHRRAGRHPGRGRDHHQWSDVRPVLAPAGLLAALGVGVSVAVTAAGAHLLLGMDWQLALLFGAIVSSTDAAAVFAVLRTLPVSRRTAGLLEAESGFNDAPTVILVLLFASTPLAETGVLESRPTGYPIARAASMGCCWAGSGGRAAADRAAPIRAVPAGHLRRRDRRLRRRRRRRRPAASSPPTDRHPSGNAGCRTARPPGRLRRGWAGSRSWGRACCSAC